MTGRLARLVAWLRDPAAGWDAALWRSWAASTALAYTIILGIIVVLTSLDLHVTRVAVDHRLLGSLLIAGTGALLYGTVLGALQWRVLRRRIPMPRRPWVLASVIPAFAAWIVVVVPAAVTAESSDHDLRTAYFLAVSQALALGPLIGFMQAKTLRPYTRRWRWWILANLGSYLVVDAAFLLVSALFGVFEFADGRGTPLESYVILLAAAPLTGRIMLWITAPAPPGGRIAGPAPAPRGRPRRRRRSRAAPRPGRRLR